MLQLLICEYHIALKPFSSSRSENAEAEHVALPGEEEMGLNLCGKLSRVYALDLTHDDQVPQSFKPHLSPLLRGERAGFPIRDNAP
jgi:hypothetical protein